MTSFNPTRTTLLGAILAFALACGGGGGATTTPPAPQPPGNWQQPLLAGSGNKSGYEAAQTAMDGSGGALMVWRDQSTTASTVRFRSYDPTRGGWQAVGDLAPVTQPAFGAHVSLATTGEGMALWSQSDGKVNCVYARSWQPGPSGGWGPITLLSSGVFESAAAAVAMDPAGTSALALWAEKDDGTHYHLWASRNTAGSGWSTPVRIQNSPTDHLMGYPQLAVDANGHAIVAWEQAIDNTTITGHTVWSALFDGTWSSPVRHDTTSEALSPSVALSAAGAQLAWGELQLVNGVNLRQIFTKRWKPASGTWGAAVRVSSPSEYAGNPALTLMDSGRTLLAWAQTVQPATKLGISTSLSVDGENWPAPTLLQGPSTRAGMPAPRLSTNAKGESNLVWEAAESDQVLRIYGVRHTATEGWGSVSILNPGSTGDSYLPAVSVGANGDALATWQKKDGSNPSSVFTCLFKK